jgi:RNA polymerase sigma factor (sigma-70 family)
MTLSDKNLALDCADARAAHALEAEAHALILAAPGGAEAMDLAMQACANQRRPTRGWFANALRAVSRSMPELRGAQARLKAADGHYWNMVIRHQRFIQRDTRDLVWGADDLDDIVGWLNIGWYQGAMRFDPDRGLRFPTMARRWGRTYVALKRDAGIVRIPRDRETGRRAITEGVRLDAPTRLDGTAPPDGMTLHEMLADEAVADVLATIGDTQEGQTIAEAIRQLPEQQRIVMEMRYSDDGATLAAVGARLELTRARIHQIEALAMETLRSVLLR